MRRIFQYGSNEKIFRGGHGNREYENRSAISSSLCLSVSQKDRNTYASPSVSARSQYPSLSVRGTLTTHTTHTYAHPVGETLISFF
jgi:hypothetical protein